MFLLNTDMLTMLEGTNTHGYAYNPTIHLMIFEDFSMNSFGSPATSFGFGAGVGAGAGAVLGAGAPAPVPAAPSKVSRTATSRVGSSASHQFMGCKPYIWSQVQETGTASCFEPLSQSQDHGYLNLTRWLSEKERHYYVSHR